MALTAYETQTRALLHDPNAQAYSTVDIDRYINLARSQIAIEGECIRALLSGGTITDLTISAGGSGYAGTAAVAFTGGAQAFASATIGGGAITAVSLTDGGWGFIPAASAAITVTGSVSGTNAVITPTIDNSATTIVGQERIPFTQLNPLLTAWQNSVNGTGLFIPKGMRQVVKVFSVACNQLGTYKPMLTQKVWSEFQAYLRIYANTQQNYPVYWSQYGQGVNGSIYLFPWPAAALQLDLDVCVTPIDLITDSTAEAVPYPWTDAIPYYAAYLAYLNSSRAEDAARMSQQYTIFMKRARSYSEAPFMADYYGYEYGG